MRKPLAALAAAAVAGSGIAAWVVWKRSPPPSMAPSGFAGSASCRGCHEEFYRLWAPSFHGLAMQPYTAELARTRLTAPAEEIAIGAYSYRAEVGGERGWVVQRGRDGEKRLPIAHVLGGKNVFYFLTPWERGRLQTLPVAYDVNEKRWFDTAASGVRHFPDIEDSALLWTERPYTFNTSCYGCHVSQLTTNFDLERDTYNTTWAEPGINCETCHGPAAEHVRFCEESEEACKQDPRIIVTGGFDAAQTNAMCGPCHAKMTPISAEFRPGDRFFDHYDLVALEHRDFYPDGRDLGENYTYTTWMLSPCVKSGQLDCVHCHTSSGRYRFAGEKTNEACLPCHREKVADPGAHSRHRAGTPGAECVSCHMPMTSFARMRRSDHSMRPPAPAASIEFGSPNACNLCHADKDAAWADRTVRQWRPREYQAPILRLARLVGAARKRDWSRLEEALEYLRSPDRDEIYAASLARLLRQCEDGRKWPVLLGLLKDPSPLVRASAADALAGGSGPEAIAALAEAAADGYRLVRIRAAAALAAVPEEYLDPGRREAVRRATAELIASLKTRPDDAGSHASLGNFHLSRRDADRAIASFETALRLQPDGVATLVNASLAYNIAGRNDRAEEYLRRALRAEPGNAAANFNLGLLLGELGRPAEAKAALEAALAADPQMAAAAFNLCVLAGEENLGEALRYCALAVRLRPGERRYAEALAYYQSLARR